jgi:hypothetical protein
LLGLELGVLIEKPQALEGPAAIQICISIAADHIPTNANTWTSCVVEKHGSGPSIRVRPQCLCENLLGGRDFEGERDSRLFTIQERDVVNPIRYYESDSGADLNEEFLGYDRDKCWSMRKMNSISE